VPVVQAEVDDVPSKCYNTIKVTPTWAICWYVYHCSDNGWAANSFILFVWNYSFPRSSMQSALHFHPTVNTWLQEARTALLKSGTTSQPNFARISNIRLR
jgi:hypothetical protein